MLTKQQARSVVLMYMNSYMEQVRPTFRFEDGKHRRSEVQDYDPTPACTYCHKAWDQTGGYLEAYRCPASPAAILQAAGLDI